VFSKINSSSRAGIAFDILFESVESQFSSYDAPNQQYFLSFIVDNYQYFGFIPNSFDRIRNLCNILVQIDQLSSKISGYASLTKLWLYIGEGSPGINEFVANLVKMSRDSKEIPHLRNFASQCLLEIYERFPKLVSIPMNQVIETAKNDLSPSALPELALLQGGHSSELKEYFDNRWWSMSPFESSLYVPPFSYSLAAIPNDPLLLHRSIQKGTVSNSFAASLLANPFATYGINNVILGFSNSINIERDNLFSPFDSLEAVSAKSRLLPPTMTSIIQNPLLKDFHNHSSENPIVIAVFDMASRFKASDLFDFYRSYYSSTEKFDSFWVSLYKKQKPHIQESLKVFLQMYPTRKPGISILLSKIDSNVAFSVISNVTESPYVDSLIEYANNSNNFHSQSVKNILKHNNISIPDKDNNLALPSVIEAPPVFSITNRIVETEDKDRTIITLTLKPTNELNDTIYGVTFTLSGKESFDSDSVISIPSISTEISIPFIMKPTKFAFSSLQLKCSYYDSKGVPKSCSLSNIPIYAFELLSPSNVDFNTAWSSGEESRVIIPAPFSSVLAELNHSIIGKNCEREDGRLQTVLSMPNGNSVAISASATSSSTVFSFIAPSIEVLLMIDEYLRTFTPMKTK